MRDEHEHAGERQWNADEEWATTRLIMVRES